MESNTMNDFSSRQGHRPLAARAAELGWIALLALSLLVATPRGAAAKGPGATERVPNRSTGRVYDPSHLRTQREIRTPGRVMTVPSKPDPEVHELSRAHAVVPDPSPQLHGGNGFTRQGNYFYASPLPTALKRPTSRPDYPSMIPNPEPPRPGPRAALHTASTGGLGTGTDVK
jgi:hypothetical protein